MKMVAMAADEMTEYQPGQTVYWPTPFGEWFRGTVVSDDGVTVIVNRTSPSFSAGTPLLKCRDAEGIEQLAPGLFVDCCPACGYDVCVCGVEPLRGSDRY